MSKEYQPKVISPSVEPAPESIPTRRKPSPSELVFTHPRQVSDTEARPLALIGDPYLVEELGIESFYEDNIDELKLKINKVDKFIKKMILKNEWKPIVKSYKDVLSELREKLNMSKNQTGLSQVNKFYLYVKLGLK
jgi:hypothetical protein